jgi:hypothetical protein
MGLSDVRSSGGGSVLSSIYDVANTTQQQISDENKAAELEEEKVTNAKNAAIQLQLIGSESQYELQQIAAMNGMDLSEIQSMAKAASGETVKYHVNNGNIESAVQTIEAAYKNGNMSTSEYQEGYFNIGVGLANMLKGEACTIENLGMITSEFSRYSKEGKITQADYNALMSYAFKKAGTQFDGVENFNISLGVCSFTLGGKKYDLHLLNRKVTDNTSDVLDRYYSSNPGTIVCLNGAMYLRGDDVWYAPDITFGAGLYNNDELYEDLRRKSASSASPNEPTYTKSTTTK